MKKKLLKEIIERKQANVEFALITNLENGDGCIFEKGKPIDKNFKNLMKKLIFTLIKRRMV